MSYARVVCQMRSHFEASIRLSLYKRHVITDEQLHMCHDCIMEFIFRTWTFSPFGFFCYNSWYVVQCSTFTHSYSAQRIVGASNTIQPLNWTLSTCHPNEHANTYQHIQYPYYSMETSIGIFQHGTSSAIGQWLQRMANIESNVNSLLSISWTLNIIAKIAFILLKWMKGFFS